MLAPQPLLEEFRVFHEKRESGILALGRDDERVDVPYREGMVKAVAANLESPRLGEYLVRDECLTAGNVQLVLATGQKKGLLFGEAAVQKEFLDPAELAATVRRQSMDLLQHVLK